MSLISNFYKKSKEFSLSKKKQRQFFGLIILMLLLYLIYSLVFIKPSNLFVLVILSVILIILVLAKFYPKLIFFPLLIWMFCGQILGEITSTIVLGLVYYGLFFPITFFIRIFRKEKVKKGWIKKTEELTDYNKMYQL